MVLENSKKAGRKVADTSGRAAHKARSTADHALRQAPGKAADIIVDEGVSMGSHAGAHFAHRNLGRVAVGVKGGLELLALIVAKVTRARPRTMRGLRASFRGTLHHSLGAGMHHKWPLPAGAAANGTKTSGAEEDAEMGDAGAEDEEASRTDY
jgi:hypothetical protein